MVSPKSVADFDHIAVRIGQICVRNAWPVFAALEQFAARAFDLSDACFHRSFHLETKMRQPAIADRLTLLENRQGRKSLVSSNLTPSARTLFFLVRSKQ